MITQEHSSPVAFRSGSRLLNVKIAEQLKREIVEGKYPVGSFLPSEKEITKRFGVAQMTVRQALGLLKSKGFISRQRGKKTVVSSSREWLTIGVLFGPSLADESACFYRAALAGFQELFAEKQWHCFVYDALQMRAAKFHPQRDSTLRQIESGLDNGIYDGFIEFATRPEDIWTGRECPLPIVQFGDQSTTDALIDMYHFSYEAMRYFVRHGRTKVAYFRTHSPHKESDRFASEDLNGLFDAARDIGIGRPVLSDIVVTEPVGRRSAEMYERALQLFEDWKTMPETERPNALIVMDDVVMRAVSMALSRSGLRAPEDVMIICMTNDRADFHYLTPIVRYTFSIQELACHLIQVLEARLRGEISAGVPLRIKGRIDESDESHFPVLIN